LAGPTHRVAGFTQVGLGGEESAVITGAAIRRRKSLQPQWVFAGKTIVDRTARAGDAGFVTSEAGRGLQEIPDTASASVLCVLI